MSTQTTITGHASAGMILADLLAQAERNARDAERKEQEDRDKTREARAIHARERIIFATTAAIIAALGIDLDEPQHSDSGTVSYSGEFRLDGYDYAASVKAPAATTTVDLRISLIATEDDGTPLDVRTVATATIEGRAEYRRENRNCIAAALREARDATPAAWAQMAETHAARLAKMITNNLYDHHAQAAGPIDRTGAKRVHAEIANVRGLLSDDQRAGLRAAMLRKASAARRDQLYARNDRDEDAARAAAEAARAAAEAAITEAARQYAAIYAQYEQAAQTWAQEATGRAWANKPAELWTVRSGRVIQETDEDGEVYRSAMQEIVVSTYDADTIRGDIERGKHIHKVERVEYDSTTQYMIIVGVADMTPNAYGDLTTAGTMAYCRTVAAQPAGVYVNIPHGSDYQPPAPPTLSEAWIDFCHRTTGHNPAQTWRAYADDADEANQADRAALQIPF